MEGGLFLLSTKMTNLVPIFPAIFDGRRVQINSLEIPEVLDVVKLQGIPKDSGSSVRIKISLQSSYQQNHPAID